MKKIFLSLVITFSAFVIINAQDNTYWVDAPPGEIKIFSVSFTSELNGKAVSAEGDVLITNDGGTNWIINQMYAGLSNQNAEEYIWTADIYCSVMQTTDSGITWFPYDKGKQEHFCGVYLKDQNSGYNIAADFLNRVTAKIFECSGNNEINLLIDHPQQCTEYYLNGGEGWALGWCVKNFKSINN